MLENVEAIEPKKPAKLFVATPMYGGLCTGGYTMGILECVQTFMPHGIQMFYSYMMNESLITRARNSLAHDFLETDCTHLMFIDADIGFNPTDILGMIAADKDIICGLYPKKEINWMQVERAVKAGVPAQELHNHTGVFVVNAVGDAENIQGTINAPLEISNGGTGFMLIQRKVFEGLIDKVPKYNSDMFFATDTEREKKLINEFFTTSIDKSSGDRLLSEDYHFCKIARDSGFTVWAAPWAKLTHCGSYNFNGQLTRV